MAIKDTTLTSADVKAANTRGQALLATTPTAVTARYDPSCWPSGHRSEYRA